MKSRTLYFTAPNQIEIREQALPALKDDEALVETICSAISAGTEMLIYRGQFPHLKDSHDNLSSDLNYPFVYGYACVGIVKELGKDVDKSWHDKLVFGFQPHSSHFIAQTSDLIPAPTSSDGTIPLSAEACSFLPNMETAVNLIHDGAPLLGERVLVLGQGIVGLLVASVLKEFPLKRLITSDNYALRRKASLDLGVDDCFDPKDLNIDVDVSLSKSSQSTLNADIDYAQKMDLTFELSGSPSALNNALAMTNFSGRVVIGSWYGEKKANIDLGGSFHRSRIKLISSQVSTISPELSGRWDKARRFEFAWEALKRIQPQKWITHRFPIENARKAYQLLDENPQETIQVIFEYKS
ncbi:MAG TPA: zinc-binding alcohol dehydrogenase [Anaerolineales bacterium]|nr:zinc-binding alcohol dehydrogenase [Anaerolineales bacterium]